MLRGSLDLRGDWGEKGYMDMYGGVPSAVYLKLSQYTPIQNKKLTNKITS